MVMGARSGILVLRTTEEEVLFWVLARCRVLGSSMTEEAWRTSLEKQMRTKRHKWVMKSLKLMEELGKGRKAESISS